jgi:acyl-CoA synthetase (AMP-forming)/AMP-acid ligase II
MSTNWTNYCLRRNLTLEPDKVVAVDEERELTNRELSAGAERLGRALMMSGVSSGDRVGILSRNSVDMLEIYFAIACAGAIAVPINVRWQTDEISYALHDADIVGLVGESHLLKAHEAAFDGMGLRFTAAFGSPEFARLAEKGDEPESPPLPQTTLEDPFAILYTSGTTGRPKGAMITHRGVKAEFLALLADMRIGSESRLMVGTPMFHIGISVAASFLSAGATLVFYREFVPDEVVRLLEHQRVSHFVTVPVIIQFLLQAEGIEDADFSGLKEMCYGGAPMPAELLERAMGVLGCGFRQLYGLTEGGGAVIHLTPEQHVGEDDSRRLRSIGRPMCGIEVGVQDLEGRWITDGGWGEVCLRGESIMHGYWGREEATAETLREGWLHTGDIGWMDDEGYVYLVDRKSDMIISGGENVYPTEVERVLNGIDGISESAVIGIADETWGEVPCAFVVLEEAAELSEEDIVRRSRESLAGYKTPKTVHFVEQLPRNQLGKLLRKELRQRVASA